MTKEQEKIINDKISKLYDRAISEPDFDVKKELTIFYKSYDNRYTVGNDEIKVFTDRLEQVKRSKRIDQLLDIFITCKEDELDGYIKEFGELHNGKLSNAAITEIKAEIYKSRKASKAKIINSYEDVSHNINYLVGCIDSNDIDWSLAVVKLDLDIAANTLRKSFYNGRYSGYNVAKVYLSNTDSNLDITREEIETLVRGIDSKDQSIITDLITKLRLETTPERLIAAFRSGQYSGYFVAKYFQQTM